LHIACRLASSSAAAAAASAFALAATARPVEPVWSQPAYNARHTNHAIHEIKLDAANVRGLKLRWKRKLDPNGLGGRGYRRVADEAPAVATQRFTW
jgi:hypothetical protein